MKRNFTLLSILAGGLLFTQSALAQEGRIYNQTVSLENGVQLKISNIDTTQSQGLDEDDYHYYVLFIPEVSIDKSKTFNFEFIYPKNFSSPVISSKITSVEFSSDGSQSANEDPCSVALPAVYSLPQTYSGEQLTSFSFDFSPKDRITGKTKKVEAEPVIVKEVTPVEPVKVKRTLTSNCEEVIVPGTTKVTGYIQFNLRTVRQVNNETTPVGGGEVILNPKRTFKEVVPGTTTIDESFTIEISGIGTKVGGVENAENAAGFSDFAVDNAFAFPNPVEDVLYTTEKVEIYSLSGVKVSEGNGEINVSNLEKGIYLVKGASKITKIVKQ